MDGHCQNSSVAYPFYIVEISSYLIMVQYILALLAVPKFYWTWNIQKERKAQMKNFSYFQSNPFTTYSATQSDLVFTKQE